MCRSKGGGKRVPADRCSVRERSESAPRALRAVERLARAGATCACDAGCRRAYCARNGAQQSLSSLHRQSRLSGNAAAIAYYSTYVISVLTQLLLQHCTVYNRQIYSHGVYTVLRILYILCSTYTSTIYANYVQAFFSDVWLGNISDSRWNQVAIAFAMMFPPLLLALSYEDEDKAHRLRQQVTLVHCEMPAI